MRTLDPQTRRAVMWDLARAFRESRQERAAVRAARAEVAAALSAAPFDAARSERAFTQLRDAQLLLQAKWHATVIRASRHLTPEERRALVESFSKSPPASRMGAVRAWRNPSWEEEAPPPSTDPAP